MEKLALMAERMNLGRLTLHTAISYLDRLVLLMSHEKKLAPSAGSVALLSASKVITPRQRVINFNKAGAGGASNSGSDSHRLLSS